MCTHPMKNTFSIVSTYSAGNRQTFLLLAIQLFFNWTAFKSWVVLALAIAETTYEKCPQDPCKTQSRGFHISVRSNSNHMI